MILELNHWPNLARMLALLPGTDVLAKRHEIVVSGKVTQSLIDKTLVVSKSGYPTRIFHAWTEWLESTSSGQTTVIVGQIAQEGIRENTMLLSANCNAHGLKREITLSLMSEWCIETHQFLGYANATVVWQKGHPERYVMKTLRDATQDLLQRSTRHRR